MTLDDDSAIVTVPPSPPESRLLVGRAAQWRAIPTRWRRHPPSARTAYKECAFGSGGSPPPRPRRSRSPTDPVASGDRWRHSRISRRCSARNGTMICKFMRCMTVALCCLPASFDCCERRSPKSSSAYSQRSEAQPMIFVVATGGQNACGQGCTEWIAGEGQFDEGAAQRFREFLAVPPKRDLPIFFNSDGGLLREAVQIGSILRENRMTAGVARTVPGRLPSWLSTR